MFTQTFVYIFILKGCFRHTYVARLCSVYRMGASLRHLFCSKNCHLSHCRVELTCPLYQFMVDDFVIYVAWFLTVAVLVDLYLFCICFVSDLPNANGYVL